MKNNWLVKIISIFLYCMFDDRLCAYERDDSWCL